MNVAPIVIPKLPKIESNVFGDLEKTLNMISSFFENDWFQKQHKKPTFVPPDEWFPNNYHAIPDIYYSFFHGGRKKVCCPLIPYVKTGFVGSLYGDIFKMEDGSFFVRLDTCLNFCVWFKLKNGQTEDDINEKLTTTIFEYDFYAKGWTRAYDNVNGVRKGSFITWFSNGKISSLGSQSCNDTYVGLKFYENGEVQSFSVDVFNSDHDFRLIIDNITQHNSVDIKIFHNYKKIILYSNNGVFVKIAVYNNKVFPFDWTFYVLEENNMELKFKSIADDSDYIDTIEQYNPDGQLTCIKQPSLNLTFRTIRVDWIKTVVQFQKMIW